MFKKITDMETAKKTAREGAAVSIIIAIITAVTIIISMNVSKIYDMDYWAFGDVAVFLIIALGIYKMSRIAAVLGLTIYWLEQIMMMASHGVKFSVLMIIFTIVYIESIRATFAYHKYKKEQREISA
ncbi:hypothetical protein [Clostridium ganghwense]|uniref:Uncharacterized protein n=1 Tax=Clostridium ganghwense TaxID=312089 RepID=A0ABT4CQG5_9CLOT|nr:hypothetical protein [Clostridium ganghwense]MCY6371303.1 hypothetical protein [Clostridium ganghwense]